MGKPALIDLKNGEKVILVLLPLKKAHSMLWHREYTRESSHLRVSERPENKQRWIIDEEAAEVVRRIYRMALESKGPYEIARTLLGKG